MSFTFGFYNALNHDRRYDAKEMSRIFDGLLTDGVYPTIGNKMMVRSSEEDNSVIVGSGRAWFNHSWNLNDADIPLTGPASHILYPRWDAVVLDINSSNEYRTNSIIWVTGTAASTPAKPAMIHTEDHNQYPLAYIYRISNNNAISDADITNTIGSDECPYAAGLLVDRKNIAQVEDNDYATKAYALGEYIIWYDQLYKVTTPILKGVKIVAHPTSGYNVKSTMIATELYEKLVFDTVPTNGSQHAVTSDGIYKALGNHSSIQTTSSVTSGSGSLITSGGIYTALGNRTSIQTSAPTNGSNNLITSGQVYTALGNRSSIQTSAPASGSNNLITAGQVYTALGNRTIIQTSAPVSGGNDLITNGRVYTAVKNIIKTISTDFIMPLHSGQNVRPISSDFNGRTSSKQLCASKTKTLICETTSQLANNIRPNFDPVYCLSRSIRYELGYYYYTGTLSEASNLVEHIKSGTVTSAEASHITFATYGVPFIKFEDLDYEYPSVVMNYKSDANDEYLIGIVVRNLYYLDV